jgi:hypothetical protein
MPSNVSTQATKVTNRLQQAIAGMQSNWPTTQTTLVVLMISYTPAQLVAKLQQVAAPLLAAIAAKIAYNSALAARNAALPDALAFIDAFFSVLPQYFPPGSAELTTFGRKPPKARTPLTVEQKQAAAAKRAATRAARHIMGDKQRKAIKATPPAPAAPPAAAPPAASGS